MLSILLLNQWLFGPITPWIHCIDVLSKNCVQERSMHTVSGQIFTTFEGQFDGTNKLYSGRICFHIPKVSLNDTNLKFGEHNMKTCKIISNLAGYHFAKFSCQILLLQLPVMFRTRRILIVYQEPVQYVTNSLNLFSRLNKLSLEADIWF